jgi:hypothetical protein
MIKLTFQLARTVERVYESSRVVIGLGSPDLHDIPIDVSSLQPEHLVILDSDGEFWALNQANDPFVTVNGRPFGRKLLRDGDRLTIGDVAIGFEGEARSRQSPLATIVPILERRIHEQQARNEVPARQMPAAQTPAAKQMAGDDHEIVALLQEVESLTAHTPKVAPPDPPLEQTDHDRFQALLADVPETKTGHSLPQETPLEEVATVKPADVLRQPPVSRARDEHHVSPALDSGMSWNTWMAMGSALAVLILFIGLGIFAALNEQSDQQEYLAAKNVADVAMALTYAQIHQVKPQNQNWTDPEFILSNLERVMSGRFGSSVDLDAQGYFKANPYLLRIYTNNDASQFLLLAQPAFSLWHWFSRKNSIVLDSTAMELRRTGDLRALNRLMSNPNVLTGANALDVSRVVREAELISLKELARETEHREFIPPRELKAIRPGAENLIHNAPRYYRLGEPVLESLSRMGAESTPELKSITEQLQRFQRLSRLVLYAGDNSLMAGKAFKALQTYFPSENLLIGFLAFQPETGAYVSSQLVFHDTTETKQDIQFIYE